MKKISTFAALLLMAAAAMFSTSCENDNINPYDYVNNGSNGSNENQGSENTFTTKVAEYPVGSVVWTKDTTLSESVEIPVGDWSSDVCSSDLRYLKTVNKSNLEYEGQKSDKTIVGTYQYGRTFLLGVRYKL